MSTCVEINKCVGCTRQLFTKSFLGDDAAERAVHFDFHTGRPERHLRLGERARGRLRIWDCGVRGLVYALRGRLRRAAHL